VIQVGGIGSRSITKNAWNGANATDVGYLDPAKFIFTSFNNPGDLMWASCADGFAVAKCESPTNNDVTLDEIFGCGLSIEEKLKNTVQIECAQE